MSYENAPATAMVATHCCVCNRPLVDAISVDVGMGPDCRRKYYAAESPAHEANRPEANRIVHALACGNTDVPVALATLATLGFAALVARLTERLVKVTLESTAAFGFDALAVKTPYSPEAVDAFRAIRGRRFDADTKRWVVPVTERAALHILLQRYFRGALAMGPRGMFVIGGAS